MNSKVTTIDEYIAEFPDDVKELLVRMRSTIQKAAPKAQEAIKYGIPTFVLDGNLVHFAAFKEHIGFYPAPSGLIAFKKDLQSFETTKGGVRFPFGTKLPLPLITKIVKWRVQENKRLAELKKAKKAKRK